MQKKGGFFICHKTKGNSSPINEDEMPTRLVLYNKVKYFRTCLKDTNHIEVIPDDKTTGIGIRMTRRAAIKDMVVILPKYFIKINQSIIINAFFVTGLSKNSIYLGNKEFEISESNISLVNQQLSLYFDSARPLKSAKF